MSRRLLKKADYLLSREKGTIFKEPGGKINLCLVYPNTYFVGMSNLGFQGVYTMLNARQDVLCERAFLPDAEDMAEYERTGAELFSLESKRPLGRFDIVAFSISFENDYPNILKILDLANIPLAASGGRRPLVAAGGVCPSSNPEPIAEFFDILFVGEAEGMLDEFIDAYRKSGSREGLFKNISGIEGIYVPGLYEVAYTDGGIERKALSNAPRTIKRRFLKDLSASVVRPSIITSETEFSDMYLIEAMRGCPWDCGFCLAGHIFNPPRTKPLGVLKAEIQEALGRTKRVGLIGPSLTDYPHAEDVLGMEGVDFSITSLRASPKSAAIAALMKGRQSISIAPEAGTERLRKAINKKITEDDIIETSRLILEGGVSNLKLYFMLGLPTETDEDIEGIAKLVEKIRGASKKGNIIVNLSTFVPKPFTEFQWHPIERMEIVKKRLGLIKKSLIPLKISVFHDVLKYSYMQGFFSMGDRRVGLALKNMLKNADWRDAASQAGVNPEHYIFRQKNLHDPLPWDFIEAGVSKEKLWGKYRKLLEGRFIDIEN